MIQGFGISIGNVALASLEISLKRLIMPHPLQAKSGNSYYLSYSKASNNLSLQILIIWVVDS